MGNETESNSLLACSAKKIANSLNDWSKDTRRWFPILTQGRQIYCEWYVDYNGSLVLISLAPKDGKAKSPSTKLGNKRGNSVKHLSDCANDSTRSSPKKDIR